MNSISRSIAQAIVPAVRRAASTAAPAATQSAKEGFKLVEVRLLIRFIDNNASFCLTSYARRCCMLFRLFSRL